MKEKKKGILSILAILVIIAAILLIAIVGIGSKKIGSMNDIKLGLDLAGGVSITYETVKENPTHEEMSDTRYKMQKRAETYSKESVVYQEGSNRINVDIPDVTDANAVLKQLGNAGSIYFVYGQSKNGVANIKFNSETSNYELTRSIDEIIKAGDVVLDGADIKSAEANTFSDQLNTEHRVELTLTEKGASKFSTATAYAYSYYVSNSPNIRNSIAIIYDGAVVSAPSVSAVISDGKAVINGQNSFQEAQNLAATIRIGALPLELKELRSNVVGAKLGSEAISTSLFAGIIGFVFVFIFMIVYYRVPGLAASIALFLYVGLMIICLNLFNVTLTLSGIAGIVLSIGMAVDANVIIFTRIKEELGTGKTVRSAIKLGFNKALSAIIDGNVTTLIAAAVLFMIGFGSIKGFAQTLAIGIVLSMFTALFITKFILNALYNIGFDSAKFYGIKKDVKVFNFIRHAKKFAILSGLLIVVGIAAMIINKSTNGQILNYGLDFQGGTSTQVTFPDEYTQKMNTELEKFVLDTLNITMEPAKIEGSNTYILKTRVLELTEKQELEAALVSTYHVDPELINSESISSTVSGEMRNDAILAVIIATICMLLYIWIRFKNLGFAASAVIALIHDVLVVIMVYAVMRISVGNTFIACMLTIVGYSINATIVIFDRIRENIKEKLKKETIQDIVNNSVSQTISRSINTSLTTFVMVLALAIFGVEAIRGFAIPLMAGIICGAYSSVCITGCLWYFFQKKISKISQE